MAGKIYLKISEAYCLALYIFLIIPCSSKALSIEIGNPFVFIGYSEVQMCWWPSDTLSLRFIQESNRWSYCLFMLYSFLFRFHFYLTELICWFVFRSFRKVVDAKWGSNTLRFLHTTMRGDGEKNHDVQFWLKIYLLFWLNFSYCVSKIHRRRIY